MGACRVAGHELWKGQAQGEWEQRAVTSLELSGKAELRGQTGGLQSPKGTPMPSEEKCRWAGTGRGAQPWGAREAGVPGGGEGPEGCQPPLPPGSPWLSLQQGAWLSPSPLPGWKSP